MASNQYSDSYKKSRSVERHNTAAWANIEDIKEDSRVMIPCDEQVDNARDYVNENQK